MSLGRTDRKAATFGGRTIGEQAHPEPSFRGGTRRGGGAADLGRAVGILERGRSCGAWPYRRRAHRAVGLFGRRHLGYFGHICPASVGPALGDRGARWVAGPLGPQRPRHPFSLNPTARPPWSRRPEHRRGRRARSARSTPKEVPRAGLEPAASRSSVLHSPKLSYRGAGRPDGPGCIKNRRGDGLRPGSAAGVRHAPTPRPNARAHVRSGRPSSFAP